ncbi:transglycosylase domain-containing protein [Blastomonas sp.]|uniref:transglycosylase domain-containing protein n=1 Tax=Blastomonas sp. TaxID=1909299 RepID=UPI002612A880|nr:transglycosylase domain-containing protein [Blastomonas sp.]MDM7956337.1 transglycosylase domain-containing protein [Blastomonas sp.]
MDHKIAAQQYFPHYKIDEKNIDIALREYDLSAKALEADQKSLTAAAGIALFFAGTVTTLAGAAAGSNTALDRIENLLDTAGIGLELTFISSIFLIAFFVIRYFALLQQSATFASRKIIVLRRLLGIDYGKIETVLPSDSLEGANEPFAITMFPGWRSLPALPVIAVSILTGGAIGGIFNLIRFLEGETAYTFLGINFPSYTHFAFLLGSLTSICLLSNYRLSLLDSFENYRLIVAINVSRWIQCPLKRRIGHIIYRMKLSVFEAKRIGIDLRSFHDILIWIEDKNYHRHNGNSLMAAIKAFYRWHKYKKRSGASTILQQLARSNFITRFDSPVRRKIIEWMLAPWLNKIFSKEDNLNLYLCSVRYGHRVIGVAAAIEYYFPNHNPKNSLCPAQIFFLIERLSNVSATFPLVRIKKLVSDAIKNGVINTSDATDLEVLYIQAGRDTRLDLGGQTPKF